MTPQEHRESLRADYADFGKYAEKIVADMPEVYTNGYIAWGPSVAAFAARPTVLAGAERPTHRVALSAMLACPRVGQLPDLDCKEHDGTDCEACEGSGVVECDLGHEHDCEGCAGLGKRVCSKCGRTEPEYPHAGHVGARLVLLLGRAIDGAQLWRALQCLDAGEPGRLLSVAAGDRKVVLFDGDAVCAIAETIGHEPALAKKIEVEAIK